MKKKKAEKRIRRHNRIRAKVYGTASRPRLSVFRSNKYIILQLIDDESGKSLLQMNDFSVNGGAKKKLTKLERANFLGKKFAKSALAESIKTVVFDRGGYKYHGRVKAAAEGAREGGLKF